MLYQGQKICVECIDLSTKGDGISFYQDYLIFTTLLLPGETAIVKLLYKKNSFWYSEIQSIINVSDTRITPKCSVYQKCGGCTLQHTSYDEEKRVKLKNFKNTLLNIAGIDIPEIELLSNNNSFYYRNRAIIPLQRDNENNILFGYYRPSSHVIEDIDHCPILDNRLNSLIPDTKRVLNESKINCDSNGILPNSIRHIVLRIGTNTGQILISFIANSSNILGLDKVAKYLFSKYNNVVGVTLNIQPLANNTIFGDKTITLLGRNYIEDIICGQDLRIFTDTFFQINTLMSDIIISQLVKWYKFNRFTGTIIDAYSGIGTISIPLAANGFNVVGIESNTNSSNLSITNSQINNISNISFINGDVNKVVKKLFRSSKAFVFDPPRKGLQKELLNILIQHKPDYIAYLSCNPATLARDLKCLILDNNVYTIDKILTIDFFPRTSHLESLTLIKKL